MDRLLAAAQWICRRVRGLCSIPPSPKVAGGSLSSTALTPTMICHLRPCHATPQSTVRGKQPQPQCYTQMWPIQPIHWSVSTQPSCMTALRHYAELLLPCVLYPKLPTVILHYSTGNQNILIWCFFIILLFLLFLYCFHGIKMYLLLSLSSHAEDLIVTPFAQVSHAVDSPWNCFMNFA